MVVESVFTDSIVFCFLLLLFVASMSSNQGGGRVEVQLLMNPFLLFVLKSATCTIHQKEINEEKELHWPR